MKAGMLYIVGTPLGNLGDLSARALEMLKAADLVAAEDTRRTGQLLHHLGIKKPLVSLHEHNERGRVAELVARLLGGESVALVSDAGMPVVSDPGAWLVEQAGASGVTVTAIPGATAATTALALSGFRGERFRFEGFPPRKPKALRDWLDRLKTETAPVICYESPFRVVKTLQAIQEVLGDIPTVVTRELTKLHEEVTRGSTSEVLARYTDRQPKGECTLVFLPLKKL